MDTISESTVTPVQPSSDCEELVARTDSTLSSSTATDNNLQEGNLNLPTLNLSPQFLHPLFNQNLFVQYAMLQLLMQKSNSINTMENQMLNFDNLSHPQIEEQMLEVRSEDQEESMEEVKVESVSENDPDYSRPNRGIKRYSLVDLTEAMHKIKSGQMGTRRASATYNIPRSTLRNKMKTTKEVSSVQQLTRSIGRSDSIESSTSQNDEQNQYQAVQSNDIGSAQQTASKWAELIHLFNSGELITGNLPALNEPLNSLLNSSKNQKPARGKRGQYRRYNKEALTAAVEAVRGGMSVHRAGTTFGVPHSTLEYKVKDRSRKGQQQRAEAERKRLEELTNRTIDVCPDSTLANIPSTSNT